MKEIGDPSLAWEEVTPGKAERWLSHNIEKNRRINDGIVRVYARDMASGAWLSGNAAPLQFDTEMRLIDGQHRLAAVVRSGQTVRMLVARGVPTEAIRAIDTGRKRSVADFLHMNGMMNANQLAALGRAAYLWSQGHRGHYVFCPPPQQIPSAQNVIDFIGEHGELTHVIQWTWPIYNHVRGCTMTVYSLACWLFMGIDGAAAAEFFSQVDTGANLAPKSPTYVLRERLLKEAIAPRRASNDVLLAFFIKAWNSYRTGSERTILRFADGEDFPEPV